MRETPTPFDGRKGLGPMGRPVVDSPKFRAASEALQNQIEETKKKTYEMAHRNDVQIRTPEQSAELQRLIAEKLKELGRKV